MTITWNEKGSGVLEYEKIDCLATVQGIEQVAWDSLGQHILIETRLGKTPEKAMPAFLALTAPAALSLLILLNQCLGETEGEEETRQ